MQCKHWWLYLAVVSGCRGAALDVTFNAEDTATLPWLRLEMTGATAPVLAVDGGISLPASFRLLVDGAPVVLQATALGQDGLLRQQSTQVEQLAAGTVKAISMVLSRAPGGDGGPVLDSGSASDGGLDAGPCPAGPKRSDEVVLYDEGPRGRLPVGYDSTRLSEPNGASTACTGTVSLQYVTRSTNDGFGLQMSDPGTRYRELELRWWASELSSWLVGLADSQTQYWLPNSVGCATDRALCVQPAGPVWQILRLAVPETVGPTTRIILQLEGAPASANVTVRIDDVRVVIR
jgi:hypothetical protein